MEDTTIGIDIAKRILRVSRSLSKLTEEGAISVDLPHYVLSLGLFLVTKAVSLAIKNLPPIATKIIPLLQKN